MFQYFSNYLNSCIGKLLYLYSQQQRPLLNESDRPLKCDRSNQLGRGVMHISQCAEPDRLVNVQAKQSKTSGGVEASSGTSTRGDKHIAHRGVRAMFR